MSTPKSLTERLSFMNMDSKALARLRGLKSVLMSALPSALEAFYVKIQSQAETSLLFSSQEKIAGAKTRQNRHWDRISDGNFDQSYFDAVTRVSEVHARIGLEPRWYIAGYALIAEHLIAAIVKERWPKRGFLRKVSDPYEVSAELAALVKATFLDMDLAISVYLEASERARVAVEERTRATNAAVMKLVGNALNALAAGDLTHRIDPSMPAEYASLREDFNAAAERLSATLSEIQTSMRTINTSIEEIAFASDDLSRRTEQQASNLTETTTALNELTATVQRTAGGAKQANAAVSSANAAAINSRGVVTEAGAAMNQIESSSQEISQIIGLIDDIAFQTNLLALNAGVEAARAGDAGRGFAVVASEVRALAQRSAEAAKAIKTLISTSSAQVGLGVQLVERTGQTLQSIVSSVAQIEGLVSGIAASAQQQSGGLSQVSAALGGVSQVVQQNAAMVEEATAATYSLKHEIEKLNHSIAAFKITQGPATPVSRRVAAGFVPVRHLTEAG
jgi:methyl-accepting chemotaxis protein